MVSVEVVDGFGWWERFWWVVREEVGGGE